MGLLWYNYIRMYSEPKEPLSGASLTIERYTLNPWSIRTVRPLVHLGCDQLALEMPRRYPPSQGTWRVEGQRFNQPIHSPVGVPSPKAGLSELSGTIRHRLGPDAENVKELNVWQSCLYRTVAGDLECATQSVIVSVKSMDAASSKGVGI